MKSTHATGPTTLVLAEEAAAGEVTARVRAGLAAFNEPKVGARRTRPLVLALRDERGDVIGGLTGKTYWNALHIELLWVSEALRSRGYGKRLVEAAEREAVSRGAELAYVTTLAFQAPGFYERLGYRQFARLEGVPRGTTRFWFSKELTPNAG